MITASLVKELRDKTGAGMMDCKKPLLKLMAILKKQLTGSEKRISKAAKKLIVLLRKDYVM